MNENDNLNIVEMLRDKAEESDINKILKSNFRGYTKKSVHEYLAVLRKQQQATQETFTKNLRLLFEEKENLRKNNETLTVRLNKTEAEYDNLSESMKSIKLEDSEFSAQDIFSLKANIIYLDEEVKKTQGEKKSLEKKINQLYISIDELTLRLHQSNEETEAQKEMLKAEKHESKKLRDTVADISRLLEEEKSEVKYLKGIMSDGKYAEFNSIISELNEQLAVQTEVISKISSENLLKEQTIENLTDEVALLKHRLSSMIQSVENLNLQNDKLLAANESLKVMLQDEYKKSIELINEKAGISIDKLIAQKNLSNAEAKITSLELQMEKYVKSEEVKTVQSKLAEAAE